MNQKLKDSQAGDKTSREHRSGPLAKFLNWISRGAEQAKKDGSLCGS